MIYILLAYYAIAFISLIIASYKKSLNKYRLVTKLATSIGFISIATYCGFHADTKFYFYVLPAFVFCLVGDILLAITDDKGSKTHFIYGLLSFLIGHILFVLAFLYLAPFRLYELIIPIAAVLITLLLLKSKNMSVGRMKPYTLVYSFFVAWLFSKGLFVFLFASNTATLLIFVGSALFLISDAIILFLYFYNKKFFSTCFLNLFTYYSAQLLLAISVYFVVA